MLEDAPLAAVDIGSNSFRLEIARVHNGRYKRLAYFKKVVRLGAGLDEQGRLTEAAAQRGLDCLREFGRLLHGVAPQRTRAVATQTLREAANRNEFLARAEQALGLPIEVITGREEARLIYAGVSFLQPADATRLVVDIGGRSTELIIGRRRTPLRAESFPVGAVGLSMRYFGDGRLSEAGFRAAQVAAGAELEEAVAQFGSRHWSEALGSSGTAGAVSDLLLACGRTDGAITPKGLVWLMQRCLEAGHVDALQLPGLKDDRRMVLPGGLAILYTLAAHFGIDSMRPALGALRQGLIVDLLQRLGKEEGGIGSRDTRQRTVRELQTRFAIDTGQSARVRATALALLFTAQPEATVETRAALGWACDLHEVGMALSHHDYHRHSAYMVGHMDAPGFSQSLQRQLADLVLAQRGGLRKVEHLMAQPLQAWLVLCLRLAVICCHARMPVQPEALHLQAGPDGSAQLSWRGQGLGPDPRTAHLLREEREAWARGTLLRLELAAGW